MQDDIPSLALQALGSWQQLGELLGEFTPRLFQALLVALLTLYLARWSRTTFLKAATRTRADVNTRHLVGRLLYIGVVAIGLATILAIFGIPPSAVVAFLGVVGLAISLALQDILKNFFAGLYLLFERPFRIGDEIRVRDFMGRVEDIGARTTTLRTVENIQILIPNAIVFAEVVTNRSFARLEAEKAPLAGQTAPSTGEMRPESVVGRSESERTSGEGTPGRVQEGANDDRHASDSLPHSGE